jgi:fructose-1,6-bisphosphatase/inositol monophosphatase family enzyme
MTFDDSHIDALADLLSETAKAEIMPRFRRLDRSGIRRKGARDDLVTEGDTAAERMIANTLRDRYPGALVVGEEAVSANAALLDGLADADLAFVVDPIDGTFNFASGLPLFCVMLAVTVKGETVAGIIHDPVGGDCVLAARDAGSFVRDAAGGLTPAKVAEPVPASHMIGALSWQFFDEPDRSRVAANYTRCLAPMNYRCVAHEYRLLAQGYADFACYTKLMPWDHLAGTLIHAEAGGHVAMLDGTSYRVGNPSGHLLAAPDPASWRELKQLLWGDCYAHANSRT